MNVLARYWNGLSPALQRYYRASLWPSLLLVAMAMLHEWATRQPGMAPAWRIAFALGPVLCVGWVFACYLRFLRDCDELERRIELDALAWAAGLGFLGAWAAIFLLDAGVAAWPAKKLAAMLGLLLIVGYVLARALLHRRYP